MRSLSGNLSGPLAGALLLGLTACKDDPARPGTFASSTEAQRQAAVLSAAGLLPPVLVTSLLPASFDTMESEGACPATSADGDAVVFSADGCVGPSGISWEGEVRTVNVPNFLDLGNEDTALLPMSVDADGWTLDGLSFDGSYWQSALMPEEEWTSRGDLTVVLPGLAAVAWKGELDCERTEDGASSCPASVAPVGKVDDLKAFRIEGVLGATSSGTPTGQLDLVADDVLSIDFDALDPDTACVPAELDGEAIDDICLGELNLIGGEWEPVDPGEPSDIVFNGSGIGSDGTQIYLDATTEGGASGVDAVVRVEGKVGEEVHPLVASEGSEPDSQLWVAQLEDGSYVPGSQTALELVATGAAGAAVMFQAFDAEGEVAACNFVGFTTGDPSGLFDLSECPPGTW